MTSGNLRHSATRFCGLFRSSGAHYPPGVAFVLSFCRPHHIAIYAIKDTWKQELEIKQTRLSEFLNFTMNEMTPQLGGIIIFKLNKALLRKYGHLVRYRYLSFLYE